MGLKESAVTALLVLVSTSPNVRAAVIDVLVVFDQAAFAASGDLSADANQLVGRANTSLQSTGLTGHSFNLKHASTATPVGFNSAGTPDSQAALSFAFFSSEVDSLRDTHAADVVVMIVEHTEQITSGQLCGRAQRPTTITVFNRDTEYVAVVRRDCLAIDRVAAHELAHILGAEHEVGSGPEQDTNPSSPYPYNHPFVDTGRDVATLMVSIPTVCQPGDCAVQNFFSNPGTAYGSPPIFLGNTSANNTAFVDGAFPVVAAYRPLPGPPPPSRPTCRIEFTRCVGLTKEWLVSWDTPDTPPFSLMDADYSFDSGASWADWYGGGDPCVPWLSSSRVTIRARIRSSFGDSEYCTITIFDTRCTSEDEDPP